MRLKQKTFDNHLEMGSIFTTDVTIATKVLVNGGIVAFPTETSFGLAVDISNENAVQKLFELKKRDIAKPLLVLIENSSHLENLTSEIPKDYEYLMEKYWPGPLTLIFPAKKSVLQIITGGSNSIGVRVSSNPVACELVRHFKKPITATSANISGLKPANNASDVAMYFDGRVDCVLTNNYVSVGTCSTIITRNDAGLICVREGVIPFVEICDYLQSF